jgi:hypothetical protein
MNLGHPSTELTMSRYAFGLAVGAALVLGTIAVGRDETDDAKAQKEVLEVASAVEKGKSDKDLAAMAKEIKDKKGLELDSLMKVYKLKVKGGLGFGPNPAANSGIEAKLQELQRLPKGPAPRVLKRGAKDLIKMAYVTQAMAEIARPHFHKPVEGKNKKDWDRWLDDQKQASTDLLNAVQKQNGPAVTQAAGRLLASCTECHQVFRK